MTETLEGLSKGLMREVAAQVAADNLMDNFGNPDDTWVSELDELGVVGLRFIVEAPKGFSTYDGREYGMYASHAVKAAGVRADLPGALQVVLAGARHRTPFIRGVTAEVLGRLSDDPDFTDHLEVWRALGDLAGDTDSITAQRAGRIIQKPLPFEFG